jgi:hypothetical protein
MVLGNEGEGDFVKPLSIGAKAIYDRTKGVCPASQVAWRHIVPFDRRDRDRRGRERAPEKPLMASRQTLPAVTSPFAVGGRIRSRIEAKFASPAGAVWSPPVSRTPEGWVRRTRTEAIPIPRGEPSCSLLRDRTND